MIVHVKVEQFLGNDPLIELHGTPLVDAKPDEVGRLTGTIQSAIAELLRLR